MAMNIKVLLRGETSRMTTTDNHVGYNVVRTKSTDEIGDM